MDNKIFNKIKKDNNMTCTQLQFEAFIKTAKAKVVNSSYKFFTFKDKYNGHKIDNPTANKNAIYYTININNVVYLQTHNPLKGGLVAITNADKQLIVDTHISNVTKTIIDGDKLQQAITNFKK